MFAIILAGGLGTRLSSLLPNIPKPMAPIYQKPFLSYLIDYWIGEGIEHFVISVGYRKENIMDYFGYTYKGIPLNYSIEDTPLGTGGALLRALRQINSDDDVLLLNGDTFFEVKLSTLRTFMALKKSDFLISLFKSEQIDRYMGVELNSEGVITSLDISKKKPYYLVNGGVYLINPHFFDNLDYKPDEFLSLEKNILTNLIGQKKLIYGLQLDGRFIDIGIPDDYRKTEVFFQEHR